MGISTATVLEVIGEHEILQRLVPQLVVADGGNDQRRGLGRRVLFAIDDEAIDIGKRWLCLRGARLRIVVAAKQLVRARARNLLKKGRERFKALMLRIAAQKRELRSVIGEGVDLAVIELDRADRLRRRIDRLCFGAKAAEGGLLFVRADPGRDRGRGDSAAGFRLQTLGGFAERVAQIVERERLEHQADGVGLVAQRGRAGREQALARAAAPELDDLEFFLANAFAADRVTAAVRARAGRLVCVRCCGRSKRRATHKEMFAERITGDEFWKVRQRILEGWAAERAACRS